MKIRTHLVSLVGSAVMVLAGCGSNDDESGFDDKNGGGSGGSAASASGGNGSGGKIVGSGGSGGSSATGGGGASGDGGCGPNLTGAVRDFNDDHADFEKFSGTDVTPGLVEAMLGADGKPVYTGVCSDPAAANPPCPFRQQMTTKANFDQWYRDDPAVNRTIPFTITLTPGANGVSTFSSNAFFPADGKGWDNQGRSHNFHFTFELHTEFFYKGGEIFTFTGDDDLWTFINGHLAIDVGGLHSETTRTVSLDDVKAQLGIEVGKTYSLDVFHAERHTSQSNFRIDTSIRFTSCGEPPS